MVSWAQLNSLDSRPCVTSGQLVRLALLELLLQLAHCVILAGPLVMLILVLLRVMMVPFIALCLYFFMAKIGPNGRCLHLLVVGKQSPAMACTPAECYKYFPLKFML